MDTKKSGEKEEEEEETSFEEMGLDGRLLRALQKKKLQTPTPVQAKCIPLALEGKDIVARARTGSGKTLAYLLPIMQKILVERPAGSPVVPAGEGVTALVLVPTRELCQQVRNEVVSLSDSFPAASLSVLQLTAGMSNATCKAALAGAPDIIVATPGRLATCLQEGILQGTTLERNLQSLVLDEADLLLSFGYEKDLQLIAKHVPRQCQCLLMSATSSDDVERLKRLVLHNPVTLTLMEVEGDAGLGGISKTVQQFSIRCRGSDKLLQALALLKLDLIHRKVLIFVNSIDSGFRLKLFLEHFGIRTAVLNAELPQNSRLHILKEFNAGLFDYLIATDTGKTGGGKAVTSGGDGRNRGEGGKEGPGVDEGDGGEEAEEEGEDGEKKRKRKGGGGHEDQKNKEENKKKKKKKKGLGDGEFGVVRGIDFKHVRTVLNFDMPSTPSGYVHRVGRTGRAGSVGLAVSLVSPKEEPLLAEVEKALLDAGAGGDDDGTEFTIGPFPSLTKAAVEGLRYRAEDMARTVTKAAIREARAKELRLEIINSERLKSHFEDNPADLDLLKHDKVLLKDPSAPHLKHVPSYLRDPVAEAASRAMKESRLALGLSASIQYGRRRRRKSGGEEGDSGARRPPNSKHGAGTDRGEAGTLWQRRKGWKGKNHNNGSKGEKLHKVRGPGRSNKRRKNG